MRVLEEAPVKDRLLSSSPSGEGQPSFEAHMMLFFESPQGLGFL
jgi:hypothetical protein